MTIDRQDEDQVCNTIFGPVSCIKDDSRMPHFSLDMIEWYSEDVLSPCGARWASAIPGYWETDPLQCSKGHQAKFKECMRTFLKMIRYMAPNDEVHGVPWEACDDCRRRCALGQLSHSIMCWPMRETNYNLAQSLQDMTLLEPWAVVDGS